MQAQPNAAQNWRFGVFEVDARNLELRRSGVLVKVREQSFRVLVYLLEHAGEIVSREDLYRALWPADTFVDFDHSLNTAVKKLRDALGDDADAPIYIETIPRRGYRFVAPVSKISGQEKEKDEQDSDLTSERPGVPIVDSSGSAASASTALSRRNALIWIAPAAVLILALGWLLRPTLPPPEVLGTTQLTHDNKSKLWALVPPPDPLLTDGSRIYFDEINGNDTLLVQTSVNGGEVIPMNPRVPLSTTSNIAPDYTSLIVVGASNDFADSAELLQLPLPGGEMRRIGDFTVNQQAATISPDGRTIYYGFGNALFSASSDGTHTHKLFDTPALPVWPRVSPDGKTIRFSQWETPLRKTSLWQARTDGTGLTRLFPNWNGVTSICCGNWTPDGKYYVFQATREGIVNLWTIRDGGDFLHRVNHDPVQLTQGTTSALGPQPSRDGRKVFFINAVLRGELMRYDPQTGAFAPFLGGLSAQGVSFSPGQQRIAYVSYPDSTLWNSKTDGTDRRQLTFPPMEAGIPRWSPDGAQIAFVGRRPGQLWSIYRVAAQGGNVEQLVSDERNEIDSSWSPDGKSLAFGEAPQDAKSYNGDAIKILDLKTRQITNVPGSERLFSPRWSPDGRWLLAGTDDFNKLVLYDFSTRKWQDMVTAEWAYPSWSADSKCVTFSDPMAKELPVYRVCLTDRRLRHLADLSNAGNLVISHFGWWTGIAPDGSILALRDIGTEEIFALDVKFP